RGGRDAVVPRRRRARGGRARLRHEDDSARRQDRRPRQSLRRDGKGDRRGRLRHRFLRRSDRDRHRRPRGPRRVDRRRFQRAGGRRLRNRIESRVADRRRRTLSRRPERRRFRARDGGAARHASRPGAARRHDPAARARRRAAGARGIGGVEAQIVGHYQKPPELYDGLRLHQNENTGGCSPRVIEALAKLRPDQIGFYPPYAAATDVIARYLGVPADRVAITNGLDEGIMALSVAQLRPGGGRPVPEAIVPEPAFEIFRFDTAVAGGALVQVMPHADFSFPLDEVLRAITPNTRVVFLTNPNNPTGVSIPLDAIRAIARHLPPKAIVFVDEAYAEF